MIDVENEIFTKVYDAIKAYSPNAFVTGEYLKIPATFPCVSVLEISNITWRRSMTNSTQENHADITYEINVYSNKKNGKKSECKALAAVADSVMTGLGFTRVMLSAIPELEDAIVYRMVGRYEAVIGTDKTIHRR